MGSAALPCSPLSPAPVAGIEAGEDFHPHLPGREGALGAEPAESAHPTHNCWHRGSMADSQCGRTSGPQSDKKRLGSLRFGKENLRPSSPLDDKL